MHLSEQDMATIVKRSSTLSERMSGGFQLSTSSASPESQSDRWERWGTAVRSQGQEPATLEKRLGWDGWAPEKARRALGSVSFDHRLEIPRWARLLAEIIDWVDSERGKIPAASEEPFLDPHSPIAFEEVLAPIVRFARYRLDSRTEAFSGLLGESARAELERSLLGRLVGLASPVLELRFSARRAARESVQDWLVGDDVDGSRTHYDSFVQGMLRGGLRTAFLDYCVLARLTACVVEQWCDATAELLGRLETDAVAIQDVFGDGIEPGPIEALIPDLSDPHHDGRAAIAIRFSSGLRLIYKPKDLGLDVAYAALVDWLNDSGLDPPLQTPVAVAREGYGWVGFVDAESCGSEAELQRYYERAGSLLCLVYVLGGSDFHYENLIASGEHPILVDLEGLMTPWWGAIARAAEGSRAETLAAQRLWDSVLRTGLLPRWEASQGGRPLELSGLGRLDGRTTWGASPQWKDVNTDRMRRELTDVEAEPQLNLPTLDGEPAPVERHQEDLICGFRRMYELLRQHRDEIVATAGPLEKFRNQRVRPVVRETRVYWSLLERSLRRSRLTEGIERSLELEVLAKTYTLDETQPAHWPLFAAERGALERLDIPCFRGSTTGTHIETPGMAPVDGFFAHSGFEHTISTLGRLDEADLKRQIGYIRAAVSASDSEGLSSASATSRGSDLEPTEAEQLNRSEAFDLAVGIATEIESQAILAEGQAAWVGFQYHQLARRYQPARLGWNLYDGVGGVALFLAALGSETGDSRWRDLSLASLASLRSRLSRPAPRAHFAALSNLGGASGLGSIVYVLSKASCFLNDPRLLEDARLVASMITPERVGADRVLDVIGGSAGAILGLLALNDCAPDRDLIERAQKCAAHLLESRDTTPSGYRAWSSHLGPRLTGFSHGAAGIAFSLLRLHAQSPDVEWLEAAKEAIEWETSVFDSAAGNWPDFRPTDQQGPQFMTAWCHGAPGIALARLGGLEVLDDERIRQDINAGAAAALAYSARDVDLLCCGNMGRTDVLLTLGMALGREDLVATARRRGGSVIHRRRGKGAFTFFANLPSTGFNPGFFQGSSGIGYQLLRLASPETLPSVLLWG